MDERLDADVPEKEHEEESAEVLSEETIAAEEPSVEALGQPEEPSDPVVDETSTEYLGLWNRLVSTTNWEKGQIISQWREALSASDAEPSSYTDEAWSQFVGNVTPQHVGRLRRVFQRFGQEYHKYSGLFWSHFQAALDWSDAEMWLEGASQNGWSISQMRNQRWEAIGAPPELKPSDADITTAELDEDVDPAAETPVGDAEAATEVLDDTPSVVQDAEPADFDTANLEAGQAYDESPTDLADYPEMANIDPVRPFENLPQLPPDMADAFETFKLAILNHKLAGWREISLDDLLNALAALRQLALAPTDE